MRPSTERWSVGRGIRLIALDIDRTTLTNDYEVLPNVSHAVAKAQAAGLRVVPATARSPQALAIIAEQLGVDGPCICFNGAWTGRLSDRGTARLSPMDVGPAAELMLMAERQGCNPVWFTDEGMYALSPGPLVARELKVTGIRAEIVSEGIPSCRPPLKILCLEPGTGGGIAGISRQYGSTFEFAYSDQRLVEVTAPDVSKKTAMAQLAAELGIRSHEVCAIGDSENDFSLLSWAGVSVAMGNAIPKLKRIAHWTTGTNEEGGAGAAIDRLLATAAIADHEEE